MAFCSPLGSITSLVFEVAHSKNSQNVGQHLMHGNFQKNMQKKFRMRLHILRNLSTLLYIQTNTVVATRIVHVSQFKLKSQEEYRNSHAAINEIVADKWSSIQKSADNDQVKLGPGCLYLEPWGVSCAESAGPA